MGYDRHDAVIAVVSPYGEDEYEQVLAEFNAWRDELPDEWQPLAVGPVRHVVNGDVTFCWLPDGSKEGWEESDDGDGYRAEFVALVARMCSRPEIIGIRFGSSFVDEFGSPNAFNETPYDD